MDFRNSSNLSIRWQRRCRYVTQGERKRVYENNTKTLNPSTAPHSSPLWKRSNQEVASCACAMSPLLARWKNNIQLLGDDCRWVVKKVFLARWNIEPSRDGGWIVSHACTCCSDLLCSAACPPRGGSTNPSPIRSLSVCLFSLFLDSIATPISEWCTGSKTFSLSYLGYCFSRAFSSAQSVLTVVVNFF